MARLGDCEQVPRRTKGGPAVRDGDAGGRRSDPRMFLDGGYQLCRRLELAVSSEFTNPKRKRGIDLDIPSRPQGPEISSPNDDLEVQLPCVRFGLVNAEAHEGLRDGALASSP